MIWWVMKHPEDIVHWGSNPGHGCLLCSALSATLSWHCVEFLAPNYSHNLIDLRLFIVSYIFLWVQIIHSTMFNIRCQKGETQFQGISFNILPDMFKSSTFHDAVSWEINLQNGMWYVKYYDTVSSLKPESNLWFFDARAAHCLPQHN